MSDRAPSLARIRQTTVHRRAKRTDGTITAACIRHLKKDPKDSTLRDLRISTDRDRVTCPVCRTAEVS